MKPDAEFINDLGASQVAVKLIAKHLGVFGYDLQVPSQVVRPDASVRFDYQDSGDILVTKRVEVKQRDLKFHDAESYPFRTILIDEQYKVDARPLSTLAAYYIVNSCLTYAAFIPASSFRKWKLETVFDRSANRNSTSYSIDKWLATYIRL